MKSKTRDDQYSEREAARRFGAALRGAFKTPPKPKAKQGKSPKRRKRAGK